MYKNLTRFSLSDSPAARQGLARVMIIVVRWGGVRKLDDNYKLKNSKIYS